MPDPVNNKAVETEEELARLEEETNKQLESEGEKQTPSSESASETTETPTEGESKTETEQPGTQTDGGEKKTEDTNEDDLSEEEKRQLSEKAQKRFRALAERRKQLEEENRILRQQQSPTTTPQDKGKDEGKSHKLPWETEDEETTEVSPEQYEADVTAKAEKAAEKKVQEQFENREIVTNLQSDIAAVETKHPELNPENLDEYDAHLVNEISDLYKAQFKLNKKLRFAPFVDRIMSLRKSGEERGRSQVTAKVAKQAAEQALGPSQTPSKSSDPIAAINSAKSIEELEALEKTLPQG